MEPSTPWEDLKFALETHDCGDLVLSAMLELMRLGESPDDVKLWVSRNVHPEGDW